MMSVSQDEDGTPTRALNTFYVNTLHAIRAGAPIAQIIGPHPFIAALSDREKFAMAPELSKWAARMVRSIKSTAGAGGSIADQTKTDVTHCALMYLFWLVMRWMLHPCADHYYAIPCWLRPTPEQLCNPHPMVMDFLVWPKIRELRGEALRDLGWLLQVCMTMTVNWPEERGGGLKGAVCIDGQSGELDLNPIAKVSIRSPAQLATRQLVGLLQVLRCWLPSVANGFIGSSIQPGELECGAVGQEVSSQCG